MGNNIGINRNKKALFTVPIKIIMFIIVSLYLLRDSFSFNIPTLFFFVLYFIGFLISDREKLLIFYMFLIPISNGPLLYFTNVIYSIFYLFKNVRHIKINNAVLTAFLIVFWEGLHLLPNVFRGYNENIIKFLGFSLVLIIATVSITELNKTQNYKAALYSWVVGITSVFSIILIKYIYSYGITNFSSIVRRFGWIPTEFDKTSTTLLINPNSVGKLVILTIFTLFVLLKYKEKNKTKEIALIIYLFLFLLMSVSRGSIIVFSVLIIIYMFDLSFNITKNIKKSIKEISLLLFGASTLVFVIRNFMGNTIETISQRFQSSDISGSRFEIYGKYLNILKSSFSLVFGRGIQNPNIKYGIQQSTHNLLIEILAIWGVIGLIIVVIWIIFLFIEINKEKSVNKNIKSIIHYLPVLGLFLYSLTGQFFISYYNTLPTLILVFLNIKYVNQLKKEKIGYI